MTGFRDRRYISRPRTGVGPRPPRTPNTDWIFDPIGSPRLSDGAYDQLRDSVGPFAGGGGDVPEGAPGGFEDPGEGNPLYEMDRWFRARSPFDLGGDALEHYSVRTFCNGCNCTTTLLYVVGLSSIYEMSNTYINPHCAREGWQDLIPRPPGAPIRPFILEGWAQCKYFVYISNPNAVNPTMMDVNDPVVGAWMRSPMDSETYIIPAYGPIVDVEFEETSPGIFNMHLICGGAGVIPIMISSFRERGRINYYNLQARAFLSAIQEQQSQIVVDARMDIHKAIWFNPRNVFWDTESGRRYVSSDVQRVLIRRGGVSPDWMIVDIRPAWSIPPYTYESGDIAVYGLSCDPPPPPPPPPRPPRPRRRRPNEDEDEDDNMDCCDCDTIRQIISAKLAPIYQILGFNQDVEPVSINPEAFMKGMSNEVATPDGDGEITVGNLPQLIAAINAVIYARGGYGRFPAKVPQSLVKDRAAGEMTTLEDAMSWQEWLIKQIDGMVGQFPVQLKLKDKEGRVSTVELKNIAEAFAETTGLLLAIAADSDFAAQIAMKATLEAARGANAAIVTQDYARAIAQYLGFKANQKERRVKVSFTPGAEDKDTFLEPSESKLVGYQLEQDETLQVALNRLLLAAGIIQAALAIPYIEGGPVLGDAIRDGANTDNSETDWQVFLQERRVPPPDRDLRTAPDVEIRDLSRPEES